MKSGWLKEGFTLLKQHASYKRDYLMPHLNSDVVWSGSRLWSQPLGSWYSGFTARVAGLLDRAQG